MVHVGAGAGGVCCSLASDQATNLNSCDQEEGMQALTAPPTDCYLFLDVVPSHLKAVLVAEGAQTYRCNAQKEIRGVGRGEDTLCATVQIAKTVITVAVTLKRT